MGAAVWLFASGAARDLDPEEVRDRLRSAGAAGALLYVALFGAIQPLGLSGHLFVLGATLVWSPPMAFALSWAGASLSQVSWFFFYRYVAREWAQKHIPARLHRYDRALIERPVRSVFIMRLLTFTWTLAPAILGVSGVRTWPMVGATLLGLLPTVAFDVWLGAKLVHWLWQ